MIAIRKAALGAALMFASAFSAQSASAAVVIDKTITLNVYQVCDNGGANCAALGATPGDNFFSAATNKIWNQAGIRVLYNFVGQLNNSNFLNIDDNVAGRTFADLAGTTGNLQSTTVVDMFLVHTVAGAYGEGWSDAGGLVMGMDDILGFAPGGRIDTMAHELGHNLGLDPLSDPQYAGAADPGHSNDPNQLMASGTIRNIPLTTSDISPNGLGYDQLSQYQINYARNSSLLRDLVSSVPEPGTWALMIMGFGLVGATLRRRRTLEQGVATA